MSCSQLGLDVSCEYIWYCKKADYEYLKPNFNLYHLSLYVVHFLHPHSHRSFLEVLFSSSECNVNSSKLYSWKRVKIATLFKINLNQFFFIFSLLNEMYLYFINFNVYLRNSAQILEKRKSLFFACLFIFGFAGLFVCLFSF